MIAPTRIVPRRVPAVLALLLAGVCSLVSPAERAAAHAALLQNDPAANAVVSEAPTAVALRFSEPLERSASGIDLLDATGQAVAGTDLVFPDDRYVMSLALPTGLPNGTYTVAWHNVSSADGHPQEGYFAFTVGTAADVTAGAAPVGGADGGPPRWVRTSARWLALLGLAPALAVWPVWLLVLRPAAGAAGPGGPALARRTTRVAAWSLGLAIGGSAVALVVQAMVTAGETRPGAGLWTTLAETRYGRWWLLRLLLLAGLGLALTLCSWWQPRRRPVAAGLALAAGFALPVAFSQNSHASAQTVGRATAVAVDVVHLLGAAVWAGGIFVLAAALLPTVRRLPPPARRDVLAVAVPRFSAVALVAWGALLLTGLYAAWLQVGNLEGLRDTPYGRSLLVKLLLVAPLLGLGAVNLLVVGRWVRRPAADPAAAGAAWARRFALTVGAEAVLLALLLLVTGRLIGQEPARDVLAARAPTELRVALTLAGRSDSRPATLTLAPGAAGANTYRLEVDGPDLPDGTEAVLRLALPDLGIAGNEVPLARADGNAFAAEGSEVAVAGAWEVEAIVRRIGAFAYRATLTLPVGATLPPPDRSGLPDPAWRFGRTSVVGLALAVLGIAGLVVAWAAGRSPLRVQGAGLGLANLAVAAALLLQARLDPPPEGTADPARNASVAIAASSPDPAAASTPVAAADHDHDHDHDHGPATPADPPAAPGVGTPAVGAGLAVTLLPRDGATGGLRVRVVDATGAPVDAAVTVTARSHGGTAGSEPIVGEAVAVDAGTYEAAGVMPVAPGPWQVVVRVAPAGAPSQGFSFAVEVPPG